MNFMYLSLLLIVVCFFVFISIIYYFFPINIKKALVDEENRYQTIDGLRGLAAISVMFAHSLLSWSYFNSSKKWSIPDFATATFNNTISPDIGFMIFSLGGFGISIFFMITGFLFYDKLVRSSGKISIISFFIKRFFRIAPLYYFVIFSVFIIVFFTGLVEFTSTTQCMQAFLSWITFGFSNIKTISSLSPGSTPVAGVLWTLPVEWKFYFCVPFLSFFTKKRMSSVLFVITGIFILILFSFLINTPIINIILPFFMGMLSSLIINNYLKLSTNIIKSQITSIIMILIFGYVLFQYRTPLLYNILLGIFFIVVSNGNSIFGILKTKIFMSLGSISYSIYLTHGIVLFVINGVVFKNGSYLLNTLIAIFFTLIISVFTYYFIEKSGINCGNRLINRFKYLLKM